MRGLRSTIALFVVLLGLGAYIYFVGSKPSDDTASNQDKLFGSLDAVTIEELKVKSESGEVTSLKKENGAWKLTMPIAALASESDASGIANALADLQVVRVVDENPADVKDYGLEMPRIEVDFKSGDGKTTGRLLVGAKTATGGNLYARRDDQKRVVLIGQYHETTFNKSTFDLRDKSLVKFDRTKADGVDLNIGGKAIEFAKNGGDWTMTKPVASRADYSAVEGLVGRVETAQMKSVVTDAPSPADLRRFGLDKPRAIVNVHLGSARATLAIGGKADDTSVYVRDAARPDVFTIEASAAEDLQKSTDDYRKKDVFDFRAFTATRVEAVRGGQTVVFERVKAKAEGSPDTWRRVSPNPGDANREKVESLLAGLANIRATSFSDSKARTGLDAPVLAIVAKFDEGKKEERVTFGKNGADAFASRPDDPGVMKIESSQLDEALKSIDELSK